MVTDPISMVLLGSLPDALVAAGAEVYVVSSPGARLTDAAAQQGFTAVPVAMQRNLSPLHDLRSVAELVRALRRIRPDLVDTGTPKAGLLGTLAARLARVPVTIYRLRGMRLEAESGPLRRLLLLTERIACGLADEVLVVSPSLRRQTLDLGLAPDRKLVVLGDGAFRGVDLERFAPSPEVAAAAAAHRAELGIGATDPVIGFVGRFSRDKGIGDLLDAFAVVRARHPHAHLVLIGDVDDAEPISAADQERLSGSPGVHHVGWTADTPAWFALMDVAALPSSREGFPSVPLEAAGLSRPCVAYRATGSVDAVVDGETGTLITIGDVAGLGQALNRYLDDPVLAAQHGRAAHDRAVAGFEMKLVQRRQVEHLLDQLPQGVRVPPGGETGRVL
jgi:glycosyltransferase involved in cell wall biosynthesis